jgi:single-stranded DNA-binding protein
VNVWRGQAEHLAESLGKGDRVMVTGRLRQRGWETPEGDKRSVTELEADEVGASLKWATAKVERSSQRGDGDRAQGRERQAERGGDFNDAPPFYKQLLQRPQLRWGAAIWQWLRDGLEASCSEWHADGTEHQAPLVRRRKAAHDGHRPETGPLDDR